MKTGDRSNISMAIVTWPEHAYDDKLLDYIIQNGDFADLYKTVHELETYPFHDNELVYATDYGLSSDKPYINKSKFKEECFITHLAKRLFQLNGADFLYAIGHTWGDKYFVPEIGHYLYATKNTDYIQMAKNNWGKDKVKYITRKNIVVCY